MKNKCKICGYRFKDNDEVICPECFTAWDDDISCNNFSKDEHSHTTTANFGETNSFIDQERREERSDSFAKNNYANRNNTARQTPPPQFNRPSGGQYQQRNTGFNQPNPQQFYHNNQTQNNAYRFNVPQYNNANNANKKKSSNGAAVVIIVICVVFFARFIPVIVDSIEQSSYNSTMTVNDSYQAFEFDYNNDEEQYYDESDADKYYDPTDGTATLVSSDGNYTIKVTGYSNIDIADEAIDSEETDDAQNFADSPDWNRLQVTFEFSNYDESEETSIPELNSVTCTAYDLDSDKVSYDTHYYFENVNIDDSESGKFVADLLVDKSAYCAEYTITMDDTEEFVFTLDFETEEVII